MHLAPGEVVVVVYQVGGLLEVDHTPDGVRHPLAANGRIGAGQAHEVPVVHARLLVGIEQAKIVEVAALAPRLTLADGDERVADCEAERSAPEVDANPNVVGLVEHDVDVVVA